METVFINWIVEIELRIDWIAVEATDSIKDLDPITVVNPLFGWNDLKSGT